MADKKNTPEEKAVEPVVEKAVEPVVEKAVVSPIGEQPAQAPSKGKVDDLGNDIKRVRF